MSKLSLTQKTTRVLRFLLGLRHPQIAGLLVEHGFSNNDLEEGWSLLRSAVGVRLDWVAPPEAPPGKIKQLDEFENKWFPIAKASLQRTFPEVHDNIFRNLAQTEGVEVVVSVGTFVERIEALGASGVGVSNNVEASARALLERRGLDALAIGQARQLLDELTVTGLADESEGGTGRFADEKEAERALWSWYREWSTISRACIKNKNFLRTLGFLKRTGSSVDDDVVTAPEPEPQEPPNTLLPSPPTDVEVVTTPSETNA
jgi:hypothetical protein